MSRRFFFWCVVLFFCAAAFIAVFYFLIYGNFFNVKTIEVSGSKLFGAEETTKIIIPYAIPAFPWRALFAPDHMLFWQLARTHRITSRVIPIFESILIKLDWGKRLLKIEVNERSFFGIWCSDENIIEGANGEEKKEECFVFDRNGVVFGRSPRAEGALLLKIRNENPLSGFLGGGILPQESWMENIFNTLDTIKNGGRNTSLITIGDYALHEWEARLDDGPKLIFSLDFIPQNLAGLLQNLEKKFDLEKLDYVDFRVQNRIFYK